MQRWPRGREDGEKELLACKSYLEDGTGPYLSGSPRIGLRTHLAQLFKVFCYFSFKIYFAEVQFTCERSIDFKYSGLGVSTNGSIHVTILTIRI